MTRIISADCHINEPPHVFDRVPAAFKDRAPKMMRGADGGDGWSFDGKPPKRTFGVEAMAGGAIGDKIKGLRFDEIMPGNYDGAAHVEDMDKDGVDVSVVYPAHTIFVYLEPDLELALACLRSYNDWVLEEFQSASPKRLVGLPMMPVDHDIEVLVAELERTVKNGAKAVFIPANPRRPYIDPYYDPFYRACEERDISLNFHRTFGGKPAADDWAELVDQNVTVGGLTHRFFSATRPFSYMTFGGVFERFPRLKLVAAEVNCGWVPFWAQTADQAFDNPYYKSTGGVGIKRRPSELVGVNLFVTILDDELGFRMIREGIAPELADCAMYSSDYPHSVCLWPHTREVVERLTKGMRKEDKQKVLSGNAARVYGV